MKFAISVLLVFQAFLSADRIWAQTAGAAADQPAEQAYKNIQVLKGMPKWQFIDTMRLMASSLGVSCDHCHVRSDQGDWPFEKDDKKPKQVARKMITMTLAINKENFEARTEVTCSTCHQGKAKPVSVPPIEQLAERSPAGEPAAAKSGEAAADAGQMIDRYLAQVQPADGAGKWSTRVSRGTVTTEFGRSFPIEVQQKGPDKYLMKITLPKGEQRWGFNGTVGWNASPGNVFEMYGLELTRLKRLARFSGDGDLKQRYRRFLVAGKEKLAEKEAVVVLGRAGGTSEKLYFEVSTGVLLRRIVLTRTPFGEFPEQTDYADYRDVDGVKIPFTVRRVEVNTRWTEKYSEIKHNVPLEEAGFEKPAEKK